MAALETEIVFDPILGPQAKKKLINESEKTGQKAGQKFTDKFTKFTGVGISKTQAALGALGVAAGAIFATRAAVQVAADFEKINTQLRVLTGSAQTANKIFEDLKEFSAETPFRLKDITQASAKLISFGFSAGEVKQRIKEIGEVAAGSGSQLGEVALIFGQVAAAGKLTGERLLQLEERAIPIGPAIESALGAVPGTLRQLVKEGKVTADVFQQAFRSLSESGGLFEGALQRQSKTISGALSTLADNFAILQGEFGKAFGPAIVESARELSVVLQDIVDVVKDPEFQRTVVEGFGKLADILLITPAKFWTDFFSNDSNLSLQEINKEMVRLQGQLDIANNKLKETSVEGKGIKATFAGDLFGGFKQAQLDILKAEEGLAKLEARRIAIINNEPDLQRALKETSEIEKQLAAERAATERKELQAREASLKALGSIGLTKEEILLNQLAREQEIIDNALATQGISEEEANRRRIEVLEATNAQILALRAKSKEAEKGIDKTAKNINKSMNRALGNGVANGIQTVTQALIKGENVFKAFGAAVLTLVADMAIQMGKIFVATGVAQLALFQTPGASILAGAALIAAGTVAKSIFGGGGANNVGGIPSGGGVSSGNFDLSGTSSTDVTAQAEEREEPSTQVQVTIQGDVLDSEETGTRLVGILNDAFEKDGVVVKGAAFA